jgi:hypothetical protein
MQYSGRAMVNCVNPIVRGIGEGKTMHTKCKRLMLCGGQAYDLSAE